MSSQMKVANASAVSSAHIFTVLSRHAEIARFPQACVRHDRLSVYEALGVPLAEALAVEYRHGVASIEAGALAGAARFVAGEGRGGAF